MLLKLIRAFHFANCLWVAIVYKSVLLTLQIHFTDDGLS